MSLNDIGDIYHIYAFDVAQGAKLKWAIEGDENSKNFHGIMNKKRSLAICGVLQDREWVDSPARVKLEFLQHFQDKFSSHFTSRPIVT